MKIKGSGNNYYEVDLNDLTCTCKDWSCRRHNFSKDDDRRLCKHLIEAMDTWLLIKPNSLDFPGGHRLINKDKIIELSSILSEHPFVISHSIGGDYFRRSIYQKDFIPIVVRLTYDSLPFEVIDSALEGYHLIGTLDDGKKRFYDGDMPIVIVISNHNYFFKEMYYELSTDEFIRLSSISHKVLGLRLTENGFIDKKNKIIDMDVSNEDDLCDLLMISDLFR